MIGYFSLVTRTSLIRPFSVTLKSYPDFFKRLVITLNVTALNIEVGNKTGFFTGRFFNVSVIEILLTKYVSMPIIYNT
jgi:hypothetical protein